MSDFIRSTGYDNAKGYVRSIILQYRTALDESVLNNRHISDEASKQIRLWEKMDKLIDEMNTDATVTGRWRRYEGSRKYFCPRCEAMENAKRNYCSCCGLHMVTPEGAEPTYV